MLPLSLFTEPVADTIWFGQVNLLLMALVVVDCLGWPSGLRRRSRLALTDVGEDSPAASLDCPAPTEDRAECLARNKIGLSYGGAPRFQSSPFWVGVGRVVARLWMVALLWMERRRVRGDSGMWPRGLLIGIAVAIKLTPAVFLLFFVLRKDYRAAVTMTVTALVATLVGFVADWSGSLTFWFGSAGGAHAVGNTDALVNQSLEGALARAGHPQTALWLVLVLILLLP